MMNKLIILSTALLLSACTSLSSNDIVTVISYEKNTDIYKNDEMIGISHTQVALRNSGIQRVVFKGVKKGCIPAVIPAEYEFDISTLNVANPYNWSRWVNGNWYKKTDKKTYFVTPVCP